MEGKESLLTDRRYHADHFKFPRSMPTSKSSEITLQSILFILATEVLSKFLSFTARIPTSVEPKVPRSVPVVHTSHSITVFTIQERMKKRKL